MKKLFVTLFITSALIQGSFAQDTIRWCAFAPPSPLEEPVELWFACPDNFGFSVYIMNGDTFNYFNGDTFNLLYPESSGLISVYCESLGVMDWIPDTTFYLIGNPQPQICIVTSDADNHPVIYFDTTTLYGNYPLLLRRQVTTLTWQTIATISSDTVTRVVDTTANLATQAYFYRLESTDCEGYQHKTIHLEANGNNLIWNAYQLPAEPYQLRGYYIYKRDSSGNFSLIDSTASLTYTDLSFQDGDEYFVEAFKDDGCPTSIQWIGKQGSAISVKSNKLKIGNVGIRTPEQTRFKYHVDGTTLHVELEKTDDISVHDLAGRQLIQRHADKLSVELIPGAYLLRVGIKGQKVVIH